MARARHSVVWILVVGLGLVAPGCQLAPMQGGMFSGLVGNQQDRKIAAHAEKSNFPTPEQVGLGTRPSSHFNNR